MDPQTASQYAFIIADYVQGGAEFNSEEGSREDVAIETPDDRTLRVTLSRPTPYFLGLTAFRNYFPQPQSFVEEQGDNYAQGADSLLYNGPYTITQLNFSNGATLEKREDYWDANNVDIETVDAVVVTDTNTALNLYQAGDLDRTGLTSDQVNQFRDNPDFSTYTQFVTWWLQMNFEDPVMSNENIRRAIQRGFDQQALAETILNNGSARATGLVPRGMAGPGEQTFREAYGDVAPGVDPEEARRLWEQGVEELGEEPTIELLTSDSSVGRDIATFLQSQLQENVGIQMDINQQPFDSRLDLQRSGDFQMASSGWIADYNDPSSFLDLYLSDNAFNDISFSNERYDELVRGARTETDDQQRMQMFSEAEQILIQEEAGIALQYFEGTAVLEKPYLSYVTHPYGADSEWKLSSIEQQQ